MLLVYALQSLLYPSAVTRGFLTLSLHDALPILARRSPCGPVQLTTRATRLSSTVARPRGRQETLTDPPESSTPRSEEHTSELQSPCNLVCRLLLEKKN